MLLFNPLPRVWSRALKLASVIALLFASLALFACGGDSEEGAVTGEEAAAAFEEAAGGYEFEKTTSLVDGAVAYAPKNDSDPDVVGQINEKLGDSSLLWQVLVFEGPEPLLDEDAVEGVAFSSSKLRSVGDGVYIGDYDTAYIADGNVVITGPVADGDPDDRTLQSWQAVLESL